MIKLVRERRPEFLSCEKVIELTKLFKASEKTVWNTAHIKGPLLSSSHGKCAYCECSLLSESNYMEVEHFEDKKHNPDKVVLWENLLPSCKKCNGAKGTHNVVNQPILNPYDDDPRDHISMRQYRFRGKTDKGKETISVTSLNQTTRLVLRRFEIGEKVDELIDTGWERLGKYLEKNDTRVKNKLLNVVEGLLEESQATSSYSASTATSLLSDTKFLELVDQMKAEGIWTDELELLMEKALQIKLDCS